MEESANHCTIYSHMIEKMATSTYRLCFCCGAAKSIVLQAKNALYFKQSIIRSLLNPDVDLTPVKSQHICDNCIKTLSQIQTIRENVTKACNTCNVTGTFTTSTTPVDCGKRSAKTPPSKLRP